MDGPVVVDVQFLGLAFHGNAGHHVGLGSRPGVDDREATVCQYVDVLVVVLHEVGLVDPRDLRVRGGVVARTIVPGSAGSRRAATSCVIRGFVTPIATGQGAQEHLLVVAETLLHFLDRLFSQGRCDVVAPIGRLKRNKAPHDFGQGLFNARTRIGRTTDERGKRQAEDERDGPVHGTTPLDVGKRKHQPLPKEVQSTCQQKPMQNHRSHVPTCAKARIV